MQKLFFLFAFSCVLFSLNANAQNFAWAKALGNADPSAQLGIAYAMLGLCFSN